MNKIDLKFLRPSQPQSWVENKTEWLSNIDIEKVLRQYENNKDLFYFKIYKLFF